MEPDLYDGKSDNKNKRVASTSASDLATTQGPVLKSQAAGRLGYYIGEQTAREDDLNEKETDGI